MAGGEKQLNTGKVPRYSRQGSSTVVAVSVVGGKMLGFAERQGQDTMGVEGGNNQPL